MKKLIQAWLTLLAIFLLSGVALGDTLYLRDGRSFRGTLIGYINGRFAFRVLTQLDYNSEGDYCEDEGEIRFPPQ